MRLPLEICRLDDELARRWRTYYAAPQDRDRRLEEGLWRRTQDPRNAEQSGWRGEADARRRLLHYRYVYDVVDDGPAQALALVALYLMYSVAYPREEVERVQASIASGLEAGDWHRRRSEAVWDRGDLQATLLVHDRHPRDEEAGRSMPSGYRSLDVTIRSSTDRTGEVDRHMPWDVLRRGMRLPDRREEPTVIDGLERLESFTPFHVEIGCGLSMESGVPPLHYLHDLYQVTDRETNRFILDPAGDDVVPRLLASPEQSVPGLVQMYRSCFLATPGDAHRDLKALVDSGFALEPIMTNNVDSLVARSGLRELYLRRYDEDVPHVDFDSRARALLVIGSHADRRRVQRRARERGLTIFFLDPEGYWEEGRFTHYPLEGVQSGDFLCRSAAAPALRGLTEHLVGQYTR